MTSTLLCLDTSDGAAVAVLRDGQTLAAARSDDPRRHVEHLAPLIVGCLDTAGITAADLTAIAVGTGPAPFTGLRVGLVTARTFAQARGLPIHGVSSLDAIAADALAEQDVEDVLVVTDARRREVYWGRYRRDEANVVHAVAGPGVDTAAQVATDHADLVEAGQVTGRGLALYPADLAGGVVSDDERAADAVVDASRLGHLALMRARAGVAQPTEALYLRRPDVHVPGRATGR
ncbi:tRNA (adenosine(37)-N6)-threonylcarbamoyltransferase complex dimerization subunit type 1 TsaB [Ruania rhizosphaerae]|uniref:tRNA (adenosine(37)-N6)-threonylcarbamoyltransferase complex dimerization subunit type 1 TsaB n=1 Tax=Ruania rhizosphaerae TaxID=1840413 RepID=UPI001359A00E|nr:tRNA (adenosine(37)-N6)-threonylcarbamoyltransferase complex dimerization subunit type 1 TsaB [Ruania rhizosphaerae]